MNIDRIGSFKPVYGLNTNPIKNTKQNNDNFAPIYKRIDPSYLRANYLPLSFTGNAPEIKRAYMLTPNGEINLEKTENNSYVVDPDIKTELLYGKDAIKYLEKTTHFDKDTHIIFPKKAKGRIVVDGVTTRIEENSAILLGKNSNAKVEVFNGYPMILTSKNDYAWYNKHSKHAQDTNVKNKYNELQERNAHLYNGDIPKSKFDGKIVSKLLEKELVTEKDSYIKFKKYYTPEYQSNELKNAGFSQDEIDSIIPTYTLVRDAKLNAKISRRGFRHNLSDTTIQKMKDTGILYNSKKKTEDDKRIFWKENYTSEEELKAELRSKNIFSKKEFKKIVRAWNIDSKTGFDLTGYKQISPKISMYTLDKKVNNWSIEPSCWLTNSTAMSTVKQNAPSMGTSIVQSDLTEPTPMSSLRKGEHLHKHPNEENRKQYEIYLVSSGCAALNVVRNGKPEVKIIKEGEVAIISPDVEHCVNSIIGEYEQIVSQVPSAFQYGLSFKNECELPYGYNEEELTRQAAEELKKAKAEIA